MDKMWHVMQSRDSKTLNLDEGFDDIMSKVKTEWMERVDHDHGMLETGGRCRSVISRAVCSIWWPSGSPLGG